MRRLYPLMQRLAAAAIPAVIEGETGTGKELLAESLHAGGPRAGQPFVVFDCTAVPPNLLESELFGHKKGAFTGATENRTGLFEYANGGTLLIDEIGELDVALQSKLLRAIERREIRQVGSNQSVRVDVRVLAATRRDLDREVAAGRFRDDLFHRLAVGRIELPPLRRRRGDVPLLVAYFCAELEIDPRTIPSTVLARWDDHSWPGNVRELHNAVARFVALGELGHAPAPNLSPDADVVDQILALGLPYVEARDRMVEEFTRRYLQSALDRSQGNVTNAAAASGVGRRYFQVLRSKVGG
jgi:DNA-binding NtrC family response regulator